MHQKSSHWSAYENKLNVNAKKLYTLVWFDVECSAYNYYNCKNKLTHTQTHRTK